MEITPIKEKEIDRQGEERNFERFTDEQLGVKSQQQRWMEEGWFKPQAQMNSEYKSDRYDAIERLKEKRKQAI